MRVFHIDHVPFYVRPSPRQETMNLQRMSHGKAPVVERWLQPVSPTERGLQSAASLSFQALN